MSVAVAAPTKQQPGQGKPKKPLWRRLLKIAGIAVASIVALVALLVVFIHTPWGKSFVRGRVEARIQKMVHGEVRIGELDYTFFFGEITLRDVEIKDASGRRAIAFASLSAELDRGSILDGTPLIPDLRIEGVAAEIVQNADGTTNLTGLFIPQDRKPLERVRVAKVSVTGAATYTKADGTRYAATDLAISASVDARPAAKELDAAIAKLTAVVEIARPNEPARKLDVALDNVTVARRPDGITADVGTLGLGVLAIDGLGAKVALADGKLAGKQSLRLGKMRVDSKELAKLLGRQLLLDDVDVDATVSGPEDALQIHGVVKTRDTTLSLDGTADLSDRTRPKYKLALAGKGKSGDVTAKLSRPVETDLRIVIDGAGASPLDAVADVSVAIGPTRIGKYALDGVTVTAKADRGAYKLDKLEARAAGFTITAAGELSADRVVKARVTVDGKPAEAIAVLAVAGIAVSPRVPLIPKLELAVTAEGPLAGKLAVALEPMKIAIAGGEVGLRATATVDRSSGKPVVDDVDATIELRGLDLAEASRLAGRPPKAHGSVSGTIKVAKKGGDEHADLGLAVALREPAIGVTVRGRATRAGANVGRFEVVRRGDRAVLATGSAYVSLYQNKPNLEGPFRLVLDAGRRDLAEIAALLPERLRGKLPAGEVEVHADLRGTPGAPAGTLAVSAKVAALANGNALPTGPATVDVKARLAPKAGGVGIDADIVAADGPHGIVATVAAHVDAPRLVAGGKLDVARARAGAVVDATVTIPERELASLADVRPKLGELGGLIAGKIAAKGPPAALVLDGRIRWHGYGTADGRPGETSLGIAGTIARPSLAIDHNGAVVITADVDRSSPDRIAVAARMRAEPTPLVPLLPKFLHARLDGKLDAHDPGKLAWNMDANVALVRTPDGLVLDQLGVTGALELRGGKIAVPKTDRTWKDISLVVKGEPSGLRLEQLELHESDVEKKDRRLRISGAVALAKATATRVELALSAHDWLLFGTPLLGQPDAPRATADFDITVAADLTTPILQVDATVNSLALHSPDRQERGHAVETSSVNGDVIFLDAASGPAGKLPLPPAPPPIPTPGVPVEGRKRRVLGKEVDARVHIPRPIRVNQAPFDLRATGELTVAVRDAGVATRGKLAVGEGSLFLFGREHEFVEGDISFTDEHPQGNMQLRFRRAIPDPVRRDLVASASHNTVSFAGPPTKPKVELGGGTNAALFEVVSMYNSGHPVQPTGLGLPTSPTVRAPRGDQIQILGFLGGNLPHLLFLDRFTAYADPYQPSGTYGQIRNVEGEAYSASGRARVRTIVRPPAPGRSNAELQIDRLFLNTDRTAAGVGLRAGDRGGGGLGLFLEWSSED
ncbi:MAG: translocation/assembly module TamB domain-containing protein [Deltaproteobacteria bacterium]|nr:translocation/assembly module TamB domain-containing protein [Deltaproteobacteria bacterium]